MVRGAAVVVSLVLFAAACSSSAKTAGPTTTPGTGTPVTNFDGTPATNADGTQETTPRNSVAPTETVPPTDDVTPTTATTTPLPATTTTAPPVTVPPPVTRWKLALDYRSHPGTNPFASYQGGWPVWSLRESQSLQRDGNYPMLPTFSSRFATDGVSAWHANSSGCDSPPAVGSNTVDVPMQVCTGTVPSNATFVYPGTSNMAVVAFVSTFNGNAEVTAGVADVDPSCGDGVRFYIDRGTTNLAALTIVNRDARQLPPITTPVTAGQSIYFVVDAGANGNNDCDTTQLAVTVDQIR